MGKQKIFNPTIDIGHVLSIIVMLGGLVLVWHRLESRQMLLESKQGEMAQRQHEDREVSKSIAAALSAVSQTQVRVVTLLDNHLNEVGSPARVAK